MGPLSMRQSPTSIGTGQLPKQRGQVAGLVLSSEPDSHNPELGQDSRTQTGPSGGQRQMIMSDELNKTHDRKIVDAYSARPV